MLSDKAAASIKTPADRVAAGVSIHICRSGSPSCSASIIIIVVIVIIVIVIIIVVIVIIGETSKEEPSAACQQ